ncbi:hypothetical protein BCR35DRAFT_332878 [Leucosporidium creatinivorum]|uniref:F-box domain-containing protein n=1 Tax=Leucosporidium creatinivorum TaxID=106004 RepID=A0A1Y2EYD4_9BASI|nr:hypothetical protein BCR35DRAFT_332878 [Leucosporidium creatinivorum]
MDDSRPTEHVQEYNEPQELPCLPNDTLAYILTFLPIGEKGSFETLINCQLVSRNFSLASKQDQVWRPWVHAYWNTSLFLGNLPISEHYCDPSDRETILSILRVDDIPSFFQLFAIRSQLDRFAKEQFEKLVSSPNSRLNRFATLCQLGRSILEALKRSLASAEANPSERLTREFWAAEVEGGVMRLEAARVWREMDFGEASHAHVVKEDDLEQIALMSCSAFASRDVDDTFNLLYWLEITARDASLFLAPYARALAEQESGEQKKETQPFAAAFTLLKKLHHLLFCYGFHPSPVKAPPSLDHSFPNLVRDEVLEGNIAVDFSLFMKLETLGTATNQETPLGILRPMLRDRSPSISWTLYTAVFCAVASRLQLGLAVKCSPLSMNKTIVKVESCVGSKGAKPENGVLLFDLGDEKCEFASDKTAEKLPPVMNGCSMLHQISADITASLASQDKPSERPKVALEHALFAALLIPSVVSRPYQGPEAVLRLTGAASKLAPHLARHFPLDLIILEDIVLPLVGTEPARLAIEKGIARVKQVDEGVEPTRRKEGEPEAKFKLGDVVKSNDGWVGVIAGYGSFDEEMYKSIEAASSPNLPDHTDQLFYWILSAELPTPHFSFTHYAAQDSLSSTDRAAQKDEIPKLLRIPGLGRWFGGVQLIKEGDSETFRFLLSKEAAARFPDDVNGPGELVDLEEF